MKSVFITGAASGIGLATAKRLFHEGWHLGLADINLDILNEGVADWDPQRVQTYGVDVCDFQQVNAAISAYALSRDDVLDAIINNAGILHIGSFSELPIALHDKTIDINLKGLLYGCYAAFPYLKNSPFPVVVNLCSASAVYGIPDFASYSATKVAVKGLTEALDIEWASEGIHVCCVMPPFVATPMLKEQDQPSKILQRMGTHLTSDDVAKSIVKQLSHPKLYRYVSVFFALLNLLSDLMPRPVTRWLIAWLARP